MLICYPGMISFSQTEYELEKTEKLLQETLDEKALEVEKLTRQVNIIQV